jgi:CDP-glucose 4,6-dehydratase
LTVSLSKSHASENGKVRILVTGHTGFKGVWLTLLLKELGFEVAGYSLEATPESLRALINQRICDHEVIGDIRDRDSFRKSLKTFKPNYVIHMAAQPLVRKSYEKIYETFEVNVLGTANILEECRHLEYLVAIGVVTTDKVYLNDDGIQRFSENSPLGGKDPYSASKVGAESAIMAWRALFQNGLASKASIFALRAGNVIGGGDLAEDRLIPDIVRSLKGRFPVNIRNSKSTRPWQHVLDPVYGYLQAILESKASTYEDYNFGPTESSLSVENVINLAEQHWKNLPKHKLDDKLDKNLKESKLLELDPRKAMKDLNWAPVWTQESAIIRTLNWWDNVIKGDLSPLEACTQDIQDFLSYK